MSEQQQMEQDYLVFEKMALEALKSAQERPLTIEETAALHWYINSPSKPINRPTIDYFNNL